jgi:septal ring factor EnvC (AmiA/AmiB activator)
MMEWLKLIFGWLNVIGLPAVISWALYDRRKIRNANDKSGLQNKEMEETLPNRVKTSSVVTLEAEILALSRTFEMDREAKERTINFLQGQLAEARNDVIERDKVIDSLQSKVAMLQKQVNQINRELHVVQQELEDARSSNGKKDK